VPEAALTLSADLESVGRARRFLREMLEAWGVQGYDLAAPQVLTELATNAALHARSEFTVHVLLRDGHLVIEVTDSSPARPQQRHYGTTATTGRGIALVEALSQEWGVEASPTGKTVWCRVGADTTLGDFEDTELDDVEGFGRRQPTSRPTPATRDRSVTLLTRAA